MGKPSFVFIAPLLAVLVSGCFEVKTKTEVHRDGTLTRTQIISGDSGEVISSGYPSRIDSSWVISLSHPKPGSIERTAARVFRDADALTEGCTDSTGFSITMRAEFQKRFLWFFTEVTYKETYRCYNPFRTFPLTDYASQSAIEEYLRHENEKAPFASRGDSLAMKDAEKRGEEWEERNIFAACFTEFLNGVTALADPGLTPEVVAAHKEKAFEIGREFWKQGYWNAKGAELDSIARIFRLATGSARVRQAIDANAAGFALFNRKLAFLKDMVSCPYSTSIVMPGQIINTNAPTIEENEATWKDLSTHLYIGDFGIWAVSRLVNWWAVVVTICVIVGVGGLIAVAIVRRAERKKGSVESSGAP